MNIGMFVKYTLFNKYICSSLYNEKNLFSSGYANERAPNDYQQNWHVRHEFIFKMFRINKTASEIPVFTPCT